MSGVLGLVRVMAEAEHLRWRLLLRRGVARGGLLFGGLFFLCAALVALHVLAVAALSPHAGFVAALAIVTGFDSLVGLVLVLCAVRMGPGQGEQTALMLRETARGALVGRARNLRLLGALVGALRRGK